MDFREYWGSACMFSLVGNVEFSKRDIILTPTLISLRHKSPLIDVKGIHTYNTLEVEEAANLATSPSAALPEPLVVERVVSGIL